MGDCCEGVASYVRFGETAVLLTLIRRTYIWVSMMTKKKKKKKIMVIDMACFIIICIIVDKIQVDMSMFTQTAIVKIIKGVWSQENLNDV